MWFRFKDPESSGAAAACQDSPPKGPAVAEMRMNEVWSEIHATLSFKIISLGNPSIHLYLSSIDPVS